MRVLLLSLSMHNTRKVRGKLSKKRPVVDTKSINVAGDDHRKHASCISPLPPPPLAVLFTRVMQKMFPHHFSFTEVTPFLLVIYPFSGPSDRESVGVF